MADIPIINPPEKEHLGFCWHHQFTIPLLFDDCLSLLQKVCALWAKLNDVIDALNEFNDEFNKWAKSVEDSLKDLYAKYTALEGRVSKVEKDIETINQTLYDLGQRIQTIENALTNIYSRLETIENAISNIQTEISNIKNDINTINNTITQIQSDLTALEARVKKLEDLLKNLNIIPPIDIYNATDEEFASGLWVNWWNWLKPKITFTDIAPAAQWEYSANVLWWDTTTRLPRYFQLGRISQPLTLCKLPFIAVCKGVFDHFPTFSEISSASPHYLQTEFPFTSVSGFFNFPLSHEFGYTMDEIKFQTSYIPFIPRQSYLYEANGASGFERCYNLNCGVRLQVPSSGTNAKLSITPAKLTMAVCPNSGTITSDTKWDMYIYMIAENG